MSDDYQTPDAGTGQSSGLAITDVYFVLFRRKWLVLFAALCGVLVAGAMWKLKQPLFQSEAKLLVKYVAEPQAIVPFGPEVKVQYPDESGATVLNSEIEILESVDLLQQVAKAVGPASLLPKGADPNDVDRAAGIIGKKLRAQPLPRSKILRLEFFHANPDVPQKVLNELIEAYLKRHDDVHSARISDSAFNTQREQLRTNLAMVEQELKALKDKAGVYSLEEAKQENTKLERSIRGELFTAQAALDGYQASYDELLLRQQPNAAGTTATTMPQEKIDEYRTLTDEIAGLSRELQRLTTGGLTGANPQVATNQIRLREARTRKASMETNYPGLVRLAAPPALPFTSFPTTQPVMDLVSLGVLVKEYQAKVATLTKKLDEVRGEMRRIQESETGINELQRGRASLEKQLVLVEQALAQSHANATLSDRQNTSISKVQAPSPPYRDFGQLRKKMAMAVAGGFIAGLVLAFIVELVLDRSLKRPKDIEGFLRMPLFLSIPVLRHASRLALGNGSPSRKEEARRASETESELQTEVISAPAQDQEMKPYHDALRDRLVTYFDIRDMTHKPKLIAVTGCKDEAGVSSVASGLAASLSETGDGNVLLVDMRGQKGAAHAFAHGKPACGLAEALENETRNSALVHENLYVVSAGSVDQKLQRIIPQQFSHFVPKLKASDYDYIIFDMPPVGQTSITAKVARFMDMVLMVIESEKTDRDVAKRAGDLLAESKASVAAVLNKRRRYVPAWLHQEFH